MPVIQFDVLVPHSDAEPLREKFAGAVESLIENEKLEKGEVTHDHSPRVDKEVEAQLRQTYRDEHEGRDLPDSTVHRYAIDIEGLKGSVNQLTMALSRFLTPQNDLPADPVLLERETAWEVPATYPWTVDILR
ncbi:hypothetical protein COCCU_09080 [Corynebacterium occultum]|uniref:Uncharacterized protein n=1 Tax=Corynebacterium occultum TaxID=2675219 RepID=A0A6B8WCJ5_9CORY|nr:hypothetical protein [Corynebacterium occultum]QGU07740.1 hypothetical protein COCCU_09080 [Corynebacterium occultum]